VSHAQIFCTGLRGLDRNAGVGIPPELDAYVSA